MRTRPRSEKKRANGEVPDGDRGAGITALPITGHGARAGAGRVSEGRSANLVMGSAAATLSSLGLPGGAS